MTTLNAVEFKDSDVLFERKIRDATEGLLPERFNWLYNKIASGNKENAITIANYVMSMKIEINLSDYYRRDIILTLSRLSIFYANRKSFTSITRQDILQFLDSFRKAESIDPTHKWIGTYNLYRMHILRFFKWLYYPNVESDARPKPSQVENIPQLKRKEVSIYKPSDLWTEQDDLLFLKFCPSKRMKCYHAVSRDGSCRPHEILKIRIKDIMFKNSGNYQYAEVLVNGKTGIRHIPLINSIPFVKDYLDQEHPQPGNPNAPFICGTGRSIGRPIREGSLLRKYYDFKKYYFPKLLDNPNVPPEDKQKIRDLLKKPWNPYIRRHSALTEKSTILKEHVLRQHAGWSPRSQMHLRYLHYYGNESNDSILEAYGITSKDKQTSQALRPKQCPNCDEPNKPDSKFCVKCRMVLTYDAYSETLESEKQKGDRLTAIEADFNSMKGQMQLLMKTLQGMNQTEKNAFVKHLVEAGIFECRRRAFIVKL